MDTSQALLNSKKLTLAQLEVDTCQLEMDTCSNRNVHLFNSKLALAQLEVDICLLNSKCTLANLTFAQIAQLDT